VYRLLKLLIGIGIRLYYKEIKVKNRQFLEHDGPIIIIANHPNTLMDAWMVGQICKQPIHFMAKGTFFNSRFKRWILGSLNMIPINRSVDEKIDGVSNTDSFEACYKVLEAGKILVIFPEGNSMMERQLRVLKTGTARIALEVEKRNGGKLNLKVIPMGLFYSKAEKFRSSVLISVEQGLFVKDYLEEYTVNTSLAARKLTDKFRIHLERVIVSTESSEQEKLLEDILGIMKNTWKQHYIEDNAVHLQEIKQRVEEIQLLQPYLLDEIQNLVNTIIWQTTKLEIKTDFLDKRFRSQRYLSQLFLSIVFILLGLPLYIFGFINSVIPYKLTDLLMTKLVKDIEYYAPIAVLLGLVIYPLNYCFFLWVGSQLFDFNLFGKIIYFFAMPITGMFAYHFGLFMTNTAYKWNYIFLVMNEKEAVKELHGLKKQLAKILFGK
jgi:1-acyl-sn-glycerol-3-phosphate acyltransferase